MKENQRQCQNQFIGKYRHCEQARGHLAASGHDFSFPKCQKMNCNWEDPFYESLFTEGNLNFFIVIGMIECLTKIMNYACIVLVSVY